MDGSVDGGRAAGGIIIGTTTLGRTEPARDCPRIGGEHQEQRLSGLDASARARMRVIVKRLLRKYGYPPDLQDAAVQNVLQQAEALSAEWAA